MADEITDKILAVVALDVVPDVVELLPPPKRLFRFACFASDRT